MSAFIVSKSHIDTLITAGLRFPTHGPLRWYNKLANEEKQGTYQRGEPWGPESIRLAKEHEHELTFDTADRVGDMLWTENRRSVNHRYDENELEELYTFKEVPGELNPIMVLKAISCYEYQSCEHPEWEDSEAHAFCTALRETAISKLPGYDDAPWEIKERSDER